VYLVKKKVWVVVVSKVEVRGRGERGERYGVGYVEIVLDKFSDFVDYVGGVVGTRIDRLEEV
jgi:hypothetical protein